MNNALTFVLTVAVIVFAAVFALKWRYQVIQDPKVGTLIIDTWNYKETKVLERASNGSWIPRKIVTGGQSVIDYEFEQAGSDNSAQSERPAI